MAIYTVESASNEQLAGWARGAVKSEVRNDLEKNCESCLGYGVWGCDHADGTVHWHGCDECDGEGVVPNEQGQAVLTFVKKHIRRMMRDML